jgi:hypothetical protein
MAIFRDWNVSYRRQTRVREIDIDEVPFKGTKYHSRIIAMGW